MCMTGGCGGGKSNNNYTPKSSKPTASRSTTGSRPTGAAAWGVKPSGNYGKPQVKMNFSGKRK